MTANPWAAPQNALPNDVPVSPVQDVSSYAVPSPGSPYLTSPAGEWAPSLFRKVGATPDPARLGEVPLIQDYPVPNRPPEEWYEPQTRDITNRHSVEQIDADGWREEPGTDGSYRFAANPRSRPPMPSRVTAFMSPASYAFWRHMSTGQPKDSQRNLNGVHFSMADHRRDYPILGMQPQRKPGAGTRNTYRLAPVPWDANLVDVPDPTSAGIPVEQVVAPTVPTNLTRSGRLM
ncbi:MAG TPA: hypothetical protein VFI97_03600 [Arthrobacter sp.]|nr:hypothetical protein [Arthrobacter sp.]